MAEPTLVKPNQSTKITHTICDSLMRYAEFLGYGDIHTKIDTKTGLTAIVAINSLKRGPAIGGCRMLKYPSVNDAIKDVLRLGYMMSYKAAINHLPHGGAKAVILMPAVIKDRVAFFEKFGEFVDSLGGRYITAMDSGTNVSDMDIIANKTKFVTCTTKLGGDNDPSPLTALGVRRAIEAAVKFKLKKDNLQGVHIAIQGIGHVGYRLAQDLVSRGAKVTITDINSAALQACGKELGVTTCAPDEIYHIEADVFSPCALGSILNRDTIRLLKAKIVAGSANNQLAHAHYGTLLHEKGILYAPDFLINAGGLIHVAIIYGKGSYEQSLRKIENIYDIVMDIFERSAKDNKPTSIIAETIARERLT